MRTFSYFQTITALILLVLFKAGIAAAQLKVDAGHYQIDKNLRLIICNVIPDKIQKGTISINLKNIYVFSNPINSIQIGAAYDVINNDTTYKLYFTRLPIINLNVEKAISGNEIGGFIDITDTIGASYRSTMGIKIRGAYSSTLPKKPYRVQLWSDTLGTTKDESIFGLRSDKRWLLLAMYNEKLRLNNKVSHELWTKLHKLYYADIEPDAHASIRTRYVEVFLNNEYQGVYLFAEDMDRKELKLEKQAKAGTGGELYKGDSWGDATLFTGVSDLPNEETELWGGWALSYPDANQTNWKNIYKFTDFVVNASDSIFSQQIMNKIREDNFVDYFLFLNLLRAEDNQGKNLFLARYDETAPYFIAPWDLDGTWGYYWSGDQKNTTDDILSNNLFNRLISTSPGFKAKLATRWFSLRNNLFSINNLYASIYTNYLFLSNNGVYERENMVWAGDYLSYSPQELDYVRNWLQNRVVWLDTYFKNFAGNEPIIYNFSALVSGTDVQLNWSANCSAISAIDVEVSTDSLTWHTVNSGRILANDTTCNYVFTDASEATNSLYYRLKIIAQTNSISYSYILSVNREQPNIIASVVSLYPNPVSTTLQLRGDVERINIYSLLGTIVYESDGSASNTIDVGQLPPGMYMVRVTQKNGSVSSHKIIVNR